MQGQSCLSRPVCPEYPYKVYTYDSFDSHVTSLKLDLGQSGRQGPLTSLNKSLYYCLIYLLIITSAYLLCRSDLEQIAEFPLKKCTLCSFSNGGQLFAAAGVGNIITVWSNTTHEVLANFKVSLAPARGMAYMTNRQLVSCHHVSYIQYLTVQYSSYIQ